MNTQHYEQFVSVYQERQKKRLLGATVAMVLGFILAATGIGAIVGVVALVYLAIEGIRTFTANSQTKQALKALQRAGIFDDAMRKAGETTTQQIDELPYAWNEEYLYLPHGAIYRIDDAAWIYLYSQQFSLVSIPLFKINVYRLHLLDGNWHPMINGKVKDAEALQKLLQGLVEVQPQLLIGHTAENQALYKQIVAQRKAKG